MSVDCFLSNVGNDMMGLMLEMMAKGTQVHPIRPFKSFGCSFLAPRFPPSFGDSPRPLKGYHAITRSKTSQP